MNFMPDVRYYSRYREAHVSKILIDSNFFWPLIGRNWMGVKRR